MLLLLHLMLAAQHCQSSFLRAAEHGLKHSRYSALVLQLGTCLLSACRDTLRSLLEFAPLQMPLRMPSSATRCHRKLHPNLQGWQLPAGSSTA